MRILIYGAVVALALAGCNAMNHKDKSEGGDHAQKVAKADLPPQVASAVNSRFPDATIRSAEKETENGKVLYDIELTHNGKHYEMDVEENGTVAETETAIDASALPAPVSQAVQAKYPGATVKEVMEKRKGSQQAVSEYEIVVKPASGKSKELTVAPDGKVTEESGGEEK
jgi:uncharacterized membrane protein YkoI